MVPATRPEKCTAVVVNVLHNTCPLIVSAVGVGFTVNVKLVVPPVHPLADGVIITLATTGT